MTSTRLLRLAFLAEACTWGLLLISIAFKYAINPAIGLYMVPFAGAAHGTAFLMYLFLALSIGAGARWSLGMLLLVGVASVPPFATLFTEMWIRRTGRMPAEWIATDLEAQPRGLTRGYRGKGFLGSRLDGVCKWIATHPITLTLIGIATYLYTLAPSLASALGN